ncbi:Uncharacterised protein [Mycobacteroides abscessus subsp. abscessus]|nr:Uncharacterised protein [Mycobacteroides abscessus subsp. abscessus]
MSSGTVATMPMIACRSKSRAKRPEPQRTRKALRSFRIAFHQMNGAGNTSNNRTAAAHASSADPHESPEKAPSFPSGHGCARNGRYPL